MAMIAADVAVIGGGPAGLAAAITLSRAGLRRVVLLDREKEAGGVPRHCGHPPFGMREFGRILTGPAYAARLRSEASAVGVDMRLRHSVIALHPGGRLDVATPDGRIGVEARRIILATGMRETTRAARLTGGARPLGVINTGALQAYLHLEHRIPFRRPVIVGTEWVGLSALSSCRRHGINPVAVIASGAAESAPWPFRLFPHLLGVPVFRGGQVRSVEGWDRVEGVLISTSDGSTRRLDCDGVVFSGQFVPEATLARMAHLSLDPGSGAPSRDADGRTSDPLVFVAGNGSAVGRSAGWSYRDGRRIAARVLAELGPVKEART